MPTSKNLSHSKNGTPDFIGQASRFSIIFFNNFSFYFFKKIAAKPILLQFQILLFFRFDDSVPTLTFADYPSVDTLRREEQMLRLIGFGVGEQIDDLQPFDAEAFASAMFDLKPTHEEDDTIVDFIGSATEEKE